MGLADPRFCLYRDFWMLAGPKRLNRYFYGGIAQLVERLLCKQRVAGSSPVTSTNSA